MLSWQILRIHIGLPLKSTILLEVSTTINSISLENFSQSKHSSVQISTNVCDYVRTCAPYRPYCIYYSLVWQRAQNAPYRWWEEKTKRNTICSTVLISDQKSSSALKLYCGMVLEHFDSQIVEFPFPSNNKKGFRTKNIPKTHMKDN